MSKPYKSLAQVTFSSAHDELDCTAQRLRSLGDLLSAIDDSAVSEDSIRDFGTFVMEGAATVLRCADAMADELRNKEAADGDGQAASITLPIPGKLDTRGAGKEWLKPAKQAEWAAWTVRAMLEDAASMLQVGDAKAAATFVAKSLAVLYRDGVTATTGSATVSVVVAGNLMAASRTLKSAEVGTSAARSMHVGKGVRVPRGEHSAVVG